MVRMKDHLNLRESSSTRRSRRDGSIAAFATTKRRSDSDVSPATVLKCAKLNQPITSIRKTSGYKSGDYATNRDLYSMKYFTFEIPSKVEYFFTKVLTKISLYDNVILINGVT